MESDELLDALVQDAELLECVLPTLLKSEQALLCHFVASKLFDRFEQTGSMDDLDRVVTTMELAVASTPDGHHHHAGRLNHLGNILRIRFERMGSIDDLDRGITMMEQANAFTADDHPDCAKYLNDLGFALQSRFERTGSMSDLDRAITTKEQAIVSTPIDHPEYAVFVTNLGNALLSRFEDRIDGRPRPRDSDEGAGHCIHLRLPS